MTTADKLRKLREEKELSQEECAKLLGIDRTTYAKYENGGSIKRNVEKLASFFNVSTDYLLGRETTDLGWKRPNTTEEIKEDAALLDILFKNDPVWKKKLKSVHLDGTFNDGKKACDLSPESIARIEDAIRISFERDQINGKAIVEIDE